MKKIISIIIIILTLSSVSGGIVGNRYPDLAEPQTVKMSSDRTELYKIFKFAHSFKEYTITVNLNYQDYLTQSQKQRQPHGTE